MKKRGQAQTIAITLLSILLIVVILLLVYLNTPLFTGRTVTTTQVYNAPQQTQQRQVYCTTRTIPYTTTEQYVEQVPYYDYDYSSSRRDYTDSGDYEYIGSMSNNLAVKGTVRIHNRDDRSRFFTIKMYYTPRNGDTVVKEDYGYVRGDDSRTFTTYYYDNKYNNDASINFDYHIDPEDRSDRILRYRDEIKTRTVTKYRTEEVCN